MVVRVETHICRGEMWGTRRGGGFEGGGVLVEVGGDAFGLEAGLAGLVGGGGSEAGGGFDELFGRLQDGLGAPGEAIDLAQAAAGFLGASVIFVEGGVDAAEDGFEGDAGLAPGLDQGPVEGVEQEDGAAAAAEALFDLGEVFVVVHKRRCEMREARGDLRGAKGEGMPHFESRISSLESRLYLLRLRSWLRS